MLSDRLELAKWIAIATMTIDHYGKIVDPSLYVETNAIGRLTYPLFAWIIGSRLYEDADRASRYLWNLGIWALISQVVYVFAGKPWTEPNAFFTLALGVVAFQAVRILDSGERLRGLLLAAGCAIAASFVDYGLFGVLMIPAIASLAARHTELAAWSTGPLGVLGNTMAQPPYVGPGGFFALATSVVAIMSLRIGIKVPRLSKQVFYAYYPAHLFALSLVARL